MSQAIRTNRHCRACGCIPCIHGTLCEGDMYPMDFVICAEMASQPEFFRLMKQVEETVRHPRFQQQPRSPKPRR